MARKQPSPPVEIPSSLQTSAFTAAWTGYLEYRKEKGWGKLATRTVGILFRRFEEWGVTAATLAIENSIANDWRGIFPPKDQAKTGSLPGGVVRGQTSGNRVCGVFCDTDVDAEGVVACYSTEQLRERYPAASEYERMIFKRVVARRQNL